MTNIVEKSILTDKSTIYNKKQELLMSKEWRSNSDLDKRQKVILKM